MKNKFIDNAAIQIAQGLAANPELWTEGAGYTNDHLAKMAYDMAEALYKQKQKRSKKK